MSNRRRDDYRWLILILSVLVIIWMFGSIKLRADARDANPFVESVKIRATCYCDSGITASGTQTRPGIIASKKEYLGYVACINAVNEDGSIGEFIGFYEILDTGYGIETGVGESRIKSGRTLGSLETGESIDIYMPTLHMAEEWVDTYGDYVYIRLVKGEG